MSTIRFKVSTWTASGIRVPATSGKVIATPTSLVIVDGDPDEIVPKTEVSATLVDGYAEIVLTPPSLTWCWNIKVLYGDKPILKGYYSFADTFAPLDFPRDLTEVVLSTLTPAEEAIPAWEAVVEVVQESVDAASRFAATAHQEALSSAASAVLSDASADLALEYQTGSQVAQGLSEDARDASQLAQSRSETAQGLSESAQSKSEIAQGLSEDAQAASEIAKGLAESAQSKSEIAQGLSEDAQTAAELAESNVELALAGVSSAINSAVDLVVTHVDTKASEANVSAGESADSAAAALLSEQHAAQSELDAKAAKEAAELAESNTNAVAFTASSSTLTPGTQATAAITGAAPNFNLNVGVPAGRDAFVESPTAPTDHTVLWVDPTTPSLPETGSPFELRGDGSPEGVKIAAVGTYYTDRICSSGVWKWIKTSGSGNTGWTPQPAALTLTNLIKNGDFANGVTGWARNNGGGVLSVDTPRELTFTGVNAVSGTSVSISPVLTWVTGHSYYVGYEYYLSDAVSSSYTESINGEFMNSTPNPVVGSWTYTSGIDSTITSNNATLTFVALFTGSSNLGKIFKIRGAILIDLTATFGSGFEPSKLEMDAYFSKSSRFVGSQPLKPKISLGSPLELTGNGSPLGVVSAPVGSYYTDLLGICGAWRWMKQSGTGNTGWVVMFAKSGVRNVASLLRTNVLLDTSLSLKMSRENQTVVIVGRGYPGTVLTTMPRTYATTSTPFIDLPSGFRPIENTVVGTVTKVYGTGVGSVGSFAAFEYLTFTFPTYVTGTYSSADYLNFSIQFQTADPWPTTLPGTPA